jgi:16S rRNA (cytosine1402-N4)-methyltransferase
MIYHEPVLLKEVIKYLDPKPNQNFIDCTLGNGGHAIALAIKLETGKVLGIDLDSEIIKLAAERIEEQGLVDKVILVQDNFKNLKKIVEENKFYPINGILVDLGISSYELQDQERGFSFLLEGPLNMRYAHESYSNESRIDTRIEDGITAAEILNQWPEKELERIFREYGEERYSKQIAEEIIKTREREEIKTTVDLVKIIERVYRGKPKPKIHFATKVFQALRIAVNDELNNLKQLLPQAIEILDKGGKLTVISFHSLEDRIVKDFFKQEARGCICPVEIPVCRCNHKPIIKIINKKPIIPTLAEIQKNPRSRSAKLRVIEKI